MRVKGERVVTVEIGVLEFRCVLYHFALTNSAFLLLIKSKGRVSCSNFVLVSYVALYVYLQI